MLIDFHFFCLQHLAFAARALARAGDTTPSTFESAARAYADEIARFGAASTPVGLAVAAAASCDVLFVTLTSAGSAVARAAGSIDVMVIDEAAQAIEAETLIPLGLIATPRCLLLVGDPMQLPATVPSPRSRRLGYDRSMMGRLMLDCEVAHAALDTQYRMHPAISRFPVQRWYGGALADAPHLSLRVPIGAPGKFSLFTVTFYANLCSHSLTRSP